MLARPADLSDDEVAAHVREHWSLPVDTIEYAPVGFGSHHWLTETHFVTVDVVDRHDGLRSALATACALRDDAGLEFVHAPVDGLLVPLGDDWVVHLYDRLEVTDETLYGGHDDPEVVEMLHRIHDATPLVAHHAGVETFEIRDRDDLVHALAALDEPWDTGPYADRCRELLRVHADVVRASIVEHDAIVDAVSRDGWVVTHGEPHRANVFRTTEGWRFVDWDTALVAPPERDWWDVQGGRHGDSRLVDLYSFRWDLMEVACYVSEYFDDHVDDANTRESWQNYLTYLDRLAARATRRA
ncbi:MAG TPA: hypothetical protein VEA78_12655 [Acidimicrobiales bacterium]|nr:hypothetical protein [Acidimicrobiales bacterium]